MTCIRDLQERAGRLGIAITRAYAEQGKEAYVAELRSAESRTLREIERIHRAGPCPCDRCRAEERRSS